MGKQNSKVPTWIRTWASQRQEQLKREAGIRRTLSHDDWLIHNTLLSSNSYLLCRFNEDEVEAIRAGLWELTKEAEADIAKKARQSREAGEFIPDSGFSDIQPPAEWEELYVRERLLERISKQEMQKLVTKRYGWGEWTDDPWGNSRKFAEWEEATKDDELAIWAVNETPGGRFYLALGCLLLLSQLDYSKMKPKELVLYEGTGAENFLFIKGYSGWERFYYPKQPLPLGYINEEIIKPYSRWAFTMYREVVFSIYRWFRVSHELSKRIDEHPELKGLAAYASAKHPEIHKLTRALAPKNSHLYGEDEGWDKFESAIRESLKWVAKRYDDIFPLRSVVEGSVLKESYVSGQEALFESALEWMEKDFMTAGLEGWLLPSILTAVNHDLIDAARKERRHRRHETTESQLETRRAVGAEIRGKKEDMTPLLDTIPSRESMPEEQMDLKKLGLNMDDLTPKELWALQDVLEGFREGYDFDSKQGKSFRQRWGKDYNPNIKAWQRARVKVNYK